MVAACLEAHAAAVLLQGAAAAQAGCTFLAASLPLMHLACLSASGTAQARLAAVQLATQLSQRRGYASAEQVSRAQLQPCFSQQADGHCLSAAMTNVMHQCRQACV